METEKENKLKKEDLRLLAVELMDLKFNRNGNKLLCDYIEKNLKEDGVNVKIDELDETGEFGDFSIDYSLDKKMNKIKSMTSEIISIGEERGLTKDDSLGLWLNHSVECMSMKIIDDVLSDIEKMIEDRCDNVWTLFIRKTSPALMELDGLNVYEVEKMWKRAIKNIKHIKFEEFRKLNKFVY